MLSRRCRSSRGGASERQDIAPYITRGSRLMTLGVEAFAIAAGDSIAIPLGTPHRVENTGAEVLHTGGAAYPVLLALPYSHDDTTLL